MNVLAALLALAFGAAPADISMQVHQGAFAQGEAVTVTVLNQEQLRRAEENADCAVAVSLGGTQVHCLDGDPPLEVTPETFSVPYEDLGGAFSVPSATVRPGERFAVRVSGDARDGCNSAGGSFEGVFRRGQAPLELDTWVTEVGCLRAR